MRGWHPATCAAVFRVFPQTGRCTDSHPSRYARSSSFQLWVISYFMVTYNVWPCKKIGVENQASRQRKGMIMRQGSTKHVLSSTPRPTLTRNCWSTPAEASSQSPTQPV